MNSTRLIRIIAAIGIIVASGIAAHPDVAFDPQSKTLPANAMWLEELDTDNLIQGYGTQHIGATIDGHPLTLSGKVYPHGIGTHAISTFSIDLKGVAEKFVSVVGLDDEVKAENCGSVDFHVIVDGKEVASTPVIRSDHPVLLSVDLRGAKTMTLKVGIGGDADNADHADWAGAAIFLVPGTKERPVSIPRYVEPPMPIASGVSNQPSINGPRIVGATPGRDFMFMIPATGKSPLKYSTKNLPAGLTLDPKTGIISGKLENAGETKVQLTLKNPAGVAKRDLTIVGGDHKLALTPPMGWNSWNVWNTAIDDQKVRDAADWMVRSGLASHGYQYINIDDCWQAPRDANGEIRSNQRFPDMKALSDYVHSKGLKFGIYSSPGPETCAGYTGSYGHEDQDAATWAKWGVDYVKYDLCSYRGDNSLVGQQKPYRVLRSSLDKCGRDIVYSICQYGRAEVWKWGAEVGGNTWRTTVDVTDIWGVMANHGFNASDLRQYAGPGHWNDPDMLEVGRVGGGGATRPSKLTPNEQITHITLWCIDAAPLLIGCDMSRLDQFTLDILGNDEVIAVDQDPLGTAGSSKTKTDTTEVWTRPLWDGTTAVAFFNKGDKKEKITAKWSVLGLPNKQPVRDLWQKKDLGSYDISFSEEVPTHGAVLIKVGKPNTKE